MTILITRHDKIGDFITALPMAKILKKIENVKIVFLVSKVNVELAKNIEFIDEVLEYTTDTITLLYRLNQIKADVSISAYIDIHLGFSLFLAKIPNRIAPATKIAQIFFNNTRKQRRSEVLKTEIEYNLDLLKQLDNKINILFSKPLLKINLEKENLIILHCGFGGSSDANLKLDDYIRIAYMASRYIKVVFTFGPDDIIAMEYIKKNIVLNNNIKLKNDFTSLYTFTKFIASSKLFVSTSTGPMHLAGLTNTRTLSFFAPNLFSSAKRWQTVSDSIYQNNFTIPLNYNESFYNLIEQKIKEYIL
jgi:ADP-heptose:LPS heptosyltransferase